MRNILVASLFLLGACTSTGTLSDLAESDTVSPLQSIADQVVEVSNEDRPVRVCLFTAIGIELVSQRALRFNPQGVDEALGRVIRLHSLASAARTQSVTGYWVNADLTDVGLNFGGLLRELAKERLVEYLSAGLSIQTVTGGVERAAVQSLKAAAMIQDIRTMFARKNSGEIGQEDLWEACESRIVMWESRLRQYLGA